MNQKILKEEDDIKTLIKGFNVVTKQKALIVTY